MQRATENRSRQTLLMENAQRVKDHALAMATQQNRLYVYLHGKIRMEDSAKEMAKRDRISEGLVCIFSIVQPCRSFAFRFEKGRPFVQSAKRKCLYLYCLILLCKSQRTHKGRIYASVMSDGRCCWEFQSPQKFKAKVLVHEPSLKEMASF